MPDHASPYRGHRFPAEVIAHAVRLYLRFALSYRDVEELLAERAVTVSYETVRAWVAKFGAQYADELRRREGREGRTWHLDEAATRVGGRLQWLWRAVDEHGQTLDVLLQERRDTEAAERFFRRLLDAAGGAPPARLRERVMRRFKSAASAQRFLDAFTVPRRRRLPASPSFPQSGALTRTYVGDPGPPPPSSTPERTRKSGHVRVAV